MPLVEDIQGCHWWRIFRDATSGGYSGMPASLYIIY
jgi:hypothetical protein